MKQLKKFYSELTDLPFKNCSVCNVNFDEEDLKYIIEKTIKRVSEDIEYSIFEFAICENCAQEFQSQISKESSLAIQTYFANHLKNKSPIYLDTKEQMINNNLSKCMLKGIKVSDMSGYTICGVFYKGDFSTNAFPYLLSEMALEELAEKISLTTKDEMDRFRKTHLDTPPEFEELLKNSPVVIL